ncbi:hypothetical protein OTU49_009404 [Cherax quadricarinatus]|uniref:Activator of basal transcription 1 n=1 Tax=Cherax quadricarinatus TaxID=27406 RepID=A0AAW0WAM6_CHEQU|nr:activator of basal transcription 1-like [Cherax quadricarinatus]
MEDAQSITSEINENSVEKRVKRKPGIIYLSCIPPNMSVTQIRDYFSMVGNLDRVYLQADNNVNDLKREKGQGKKYSKNLRFTEGWIEFKSKRKAKQAHFFLNNQPVGGKKSNPYYDMLWNIKYLPRFKWAFLKQRLEYEREVHRQRMGAEISQVRRETDHFIKTSEISEKNQRKLAKTQKKKKNDKQELQAESQKKEITGNEKMFVFKQKELENEILSKSEVRKKKNELIRNRIAEKKKKRREIKMKKKELSKKPEDDFLGSVFVGSSL